MKRLGLLLPVVLVLAACGGSGSANSNETAQITSNWEKFFSSKTNVPGKIALLQDGPRFELVVKSFYYNPLAKNVSATVSSITMEGADKAKVVYVVKVGGASLGKQTGVAVKQNGTWKVGDAALCKLISLGGSTPSVCKS